MTLSSACIDIYANFALPNVNLLWRDDGSDDSTMIKNTSMYFKKMITHLIAIIIIDKYFYNNNAQYNLWFDKI